MANFDDRSGFIPCPTSWGQWWQTMDEVFVEVNVPEGTRAKDIKCNITTSHLSVVVSGKTLIEGDLFDKVHGSDSVWTLEDKKFLRICLLKSNKSASNCWKSLLVGQYEANPYIFDQMQQKLTLQRFQYENPGMDFSGASITGNYHGGGPELPSQ